jgi:hypothetical protein
MALFTDGVPSSMEDLTGQDSQLLDVASTEGIDVGRKLSLAQDELAVELNALLSRARSADGAGGMFWVGGALDATNVVVTPALKLWHTFRTLELTYRDAYYAQLNDRYAGKRDAFRDMARWARENLRELGIGIVWSPVPQAAMPDVSTASGTLAAGTYWVSMAWVNSAGEEGASATPAIATITGTTLSAKPGRAPVSATGWNVYVGDSPETMTRQNATPLGTATSWTQPGTLLATGNAAGQGQAANYLFAAPRLLQRG